MNDLISRQAAIDTLRMDISIIPFAKAREYVRAAIETIYNRLEELPSAQPEQQWIPCDVRMPEEPFGCWLTVHVDSPYYGEKNIVYHNIYGWDGESWNDSYGEPVEWTVYEEVVAWCKAKLPEPYREEGGADGQR